MGYACAALGGGLVALGLGYIWFVWYMSRENM